MGRRERVRIIETARRDVHRRGRIVMRISELRSARAAKAPAHGCGGTKRGGMTLHELKLGLRKGHPRHDRGGGDAPARSTVADHGVARPAPHAVADGPAYAPAFGDIVCVWHGPHFAVCRCTSITH